MPKLFSVDEMPRIDGLEMPHDFYVVLMEPSPLAGMHYPGLRTPWKNLGAAGFTSIVCLTGSQVCYNPYPLRVLYSAELEDLHHGNSPRDPIRQERLIREATKVIVEGLSRGEGIIVHCAGGTGRTGTILGCVLRELGYTASTAISYLDMIDRERGVGGWPESEWQAEMVRTY